MKLWILTRRGPTRYDMTRAAVVRAQSAKAAIAMLEEDEGREEFVANRLFEDGEPGVLVVDFLEG